MVNGIQANSAKDAARKFAGSLLDSGYVPTAIYEYRNTSDEIIYWRIRCDHPTLEKWIRPMCLKEDGLYYLIEPDFGDNRKPLYGLQLLAKYPETVVWIVEGEKCTDALNKFFELNGSMSCNIAITSGGANSASGADWSVLSGRAVVIFPDHDEPGQSYAKTVCTALTGIAASIEVIDVQKIGLQDKGDVADWLESDASRSLDDLMSLPRIDTVRTDDIGAIEPDAQLQEPDMSILRQGRRMPPQFPVDVLGQEVGFWALEAAKSASAPVDYVAGSFIATCASLIGNARRVSPGGDWVEPSILWIGLVGDPSSGKSPGTDAVLGLIKIVEQEMIPDFELEFRKWQTAKEIASSVRKKWETDVDVAININKTPPPMPEQATEPVEVLRPRIKVNDTTIEKLGQLLSVHSKGLLFNRDELSGWSGGFDRYGNKGSERSFWVETYGGRSYTVDRVKNPKPIHIPFLSVSVLGGIQPEKLNSVISGDDDGFAARFLWLYPDAIPPKRRYDKVDSLAVLGAMRRLLVLKPSEDVVGECKPVIIALAEDAANVFHEWNSNNYEYGKNTFGLMKSFYGKNNGQVLRLALVFEYIWWAVSDNEHEPVYISKKAVDAAILCMKEYFQPMAEQVFGDAAIPEEDRLAGRLARYIIKNKLVVINERELRRGAGIPDLRDSGKVSVAITRLIEANWLCPTSKDKAVGRPAKNHDVNQRVFELAKEL